MTTSWRARLHRAAALSLVLAVAPLAVATSAPLSTAAAPPQSATSAAVPGFGHWHGESVLDPIARSRTLAAVSCAGRRRMKRRCVGLGDRTDRRGNDGSYSEVGNGTTWHVVYTAHPHRVGGLEPSGQTGYELRDVSCWAPNRCIAVGEFFRKPGHERPLAERWNGHSWTVIHAPAPRDSAKLDHISCATATACMAVGTTTSGDRATAPHLVERWNGSRWSITHPRLPTGADAVTITSVSCPTGTSCTVAGSMASSGAVAPFADTFSHGTWRTDELPAAAGQLLTVDCAAATACVMVATVGAGISASSYSLSGHADTWTQTSLPEGLVNASIACTSTTACVVAGSTIVLSDETPDKHVAAMASWDGSSWTPIKLFGRDVFDISCSSGSFCVLAGDNGSGAEVEGEEGRPGHFGFLTYVHRAIVHGDFSTPPFPKASSGLGLVSVSCPTSAMCMAVRNDGAVEREHARVWRVSRPGNGVEGLESVSCVSPTWCMAVGTGPGHKFSLTAVWNGRGWRTLRRSAAEPPHLALGAVSCTSRTFCLAIDEVTSTGDERSNWAQRWNGHSWRPARRPTNTVTTVMTSVSCTSRHFCAAVGYKPTDHEGGATVTQVWRGSHWRPAAVVPMAIDGAEDPELASVSCVSGTYCLAVGSYSQGPDFADRWNGREWKSIQPPIGQLAVGVSCAARTRCMAVSGNFEGEREVDVEPSSWNGTSWTSHPVPGTALLAAVSCVALTCTVVGEEFAGSEPSVAFRIN
jgi:hypothetical protein